MLAQLKIGLPQLTSSTKCINENRRWRDLPKVLYSIKKCPKYCARVPKSSWKVYRQHCQQTVFAVRSASLHVMRLRGSSQGRWGCGRTMRPVQSWGKVSTIGKTDSFGVVILHQQRSDAPFIYGRLVDSDAAAAAERRYLYHFSERNYRRERYFNFR